MEKIRKPFQGVANIIRFNWHFYVFASLAILFILLVKTQFSNDFAVFFDFIVISIVGSTTLSLAVSYYIYDASGLYELVFLDFLDLKKQHKMANINAGFDETSAILQAKFPETELSVYDFYDAERHTEISIERARKVYPPFPNTQRINTANIPCENATFDVVFLIFAAHEIRDDAERVLFFQEIKRILKPEGKVILIEHLRDVPNFLAYNIGFFHFLNKKTWQNTFSNAGFEILEEKKFTPFVSIFTVAPDLFGKK